MRSTRTAASRARTTAATACGSTSKHRLGDERSRSTSPSYHRRPRRLGAAGTGVLIDEDSLHYHYFPGVRADAGFWLNSARTFAFEADGFLLAKEGASLSYGPAPNLFLPVLTPAGQAAVPLSAVDPAGVDSASRLWGTDANLMLSAVVAAATLPC